MSLFEIGAFLIGLSALFGYINHRYLHAPHMIGLVLIARDAVPVLTWGGLRGGIAVALALSLPPNEFRPFILNVTYVVVLFSIIVQGLTVTRLIRRVVPK